MTTGSSCRRNNRTLTRNNQGALVIDEGVYLCAAAFRASAMA